MQYHFLILVWHTELYLGRDLDRIYVNWIYTYLYLSQ